MHPTSRRLSRLLPFITIPATMVLPTQILRLSTARLVLSVVGGLCLAGLLVFLLGRGLQILGVFGHICCWSCSCGGRVRVGAEGREEER